MLCLGSSWLVRGRLFRERKDASLHPSFYPILIIDCVALSEQYVVELASLPHFRGISSSPAAFLFLILLRTESSSSLVKGPSLTSNCLLIILVIGSSVISGGFPCRFLKCCSHSFTLSCWLAAFNFALAVLFLLLTSFIVCQAILDCLSSTESLILSIWFCMYSACSFRYIPANWYFDFSSFRAFVFVGFFRELLEAVFTSARFSVTASVSQGTLYLVLGFVGIHFDAASRCASTKFSYSSFGVPFSVFSCSASNLFLNSNRY